MPPIALRLSVEELALVYNQIGRADLADHLISARYGSLSREDYATRLVAAGNSMMARNLLKPVPGEPMNTLDETLQKVGEQIASSSFNIWCSRNALTSVEDVTYIFGKDYVYENRVEMNVVNQITQLRSANVAIQGAAALFGMEKAEAFTCPPALIPNTALSEFMDVKDVVPIMQRLKDPEISTAIPEKTRTIFAEDWEKSVYWGLVLRVEYKKGSPVIFDRGFLVLHGPKRFWIMRPTEYGGESVMEVLPATQDTFVKEMKGLLK